MGRHYGTKTMAEAAPLIDAIAAAAAEKMDANFKAMRQKTSQQAEDKGVATLNSTVNIVEESSVGESVVTGEIYLPRQNLGIKAGQVFSKKLTDSITNTLDKSMKELHITSDNKELVKLLDSKVKSKKIDASDKFLINNIEKLSRAISGSQRQANNLQALQTFHPNDLKELDKVARRFAYSTDTCIQMFEGLSEAGRKLLNDVALIPKDIKKSLSSGKRSSDNLYDLLYGSIYNEHSKNLERYLQYGQITQVPKQGKNRYLSNNLANVPMDIDAIHQMAKLFRENPYEANAKKLRGAKGASIVYTFDKAPNKLWNDISTDENKYLIDKIAALLSADSMAALQRSRIPPEERFIQSRQGGMKLLPVPEKRVDENINSKKATDFGKLIQPIRKMFTSSVSNSRAKGSPLSQFTTLVNNIMDKSAHDSKYTQSQALNDLRFGLTTISGQGVSIAKIDKIIEEVNRIEQEGLKAKKKKAKKESTKEEKTKEDSSTNTKEIESETKALEENTAATKKNEEAKKESKNTSKSKESESKAEASTHDSNTTAIEKETAAIQKNTSAKQKNQKQISGGGGNNRGRGNNTPPALPPPDDDWETTKVVETRERGSENSAILKRQMYQRKKNDHSYQRILHSTVDEDTGKLIDSGSTYTNDISGRIKEAEKAEKQAQAESAKQQKERIAQNKAAAKYAKETTKEYEKYLATLEKIADLQSKLDVATYKGDKVRAEALKEDIAKTVQEANAAYNNIENRMHSLNGTPPSAYEKARFDRLSGLRSRAYGSGYEEEFINNDFERFFREGNKNGYENRSRKATAEIQAQQLKEYKSSYDQLISSVQKYINMQDKSSVSAKLATESIQQQVVALQEQKSAMTATGVSDETIKQIEAASSSKIQQSVMSKGANIADKYISQINNTRKALEELGFISKEDQAILNSLEDNINNIFAQGGNIKNINDIGAWMSSIHQVGEQGQASLSTLQKKASDIQYIRESSEKVQQYQGLISSFQKVKGISLEADAILKSFNSRVQEVGKSLYTFDSNRPTAEIEKFAAELRETMSELALLEKSMNQSMKSKGFAWSGVNGMFAPGTVSTIEQAKQALKEYAAAEDYVIQTSLKFNAANNTMVGTYKNVAGQVSTITAQFNAQGQSLNILNKQVGAQQSIFSGLASSFGNFFKLYFTTFTVVPRVISAVKSGFATFSDYNKSLLNISYTMDLTNDQLNDLGENALKSARDLGMAVDQMTAIYQVYSNMEITPEQLAKQAEPTAILANLSGEEATTAADQIQAVLNQYKMLAEDDSPENAAKQASHVVDVLDKISANIALDYSKGISVMSEATEIAGATASDAGLSFEKLAAIAGKVGETTRQSGSQIGNALKTIMVRLSKASKLSDDGEVDNATLSQASAALEKIGIQVYDKSGEYRNFDTIMTELAAKWDSLSDAQQRNISFAIAATRQTNLLNVMLSTYADAEDLAKQATEANGNALANQEKYLESTAGHLQTLSTAVNTVWIRLFQSLPINAITGLLADFMKFLAFATDKAPVLTAIITPLVAGRLFVSGRAVFGSLQGELGTAIGLAGKLKALLNTIPNFGKNLFAAPEMVAKAKGALEKAGMEATWSNVAQQIWYGDASKVKQANQTKDLASGAKAAAAKEAEAAASAEVIAANEAEAAASAKAAAANEAEAAASAKSTVADEAEAVASAEAEAADTAEAVASAEAAVADSAEAEASGLASVADEAEAAASAEAAVADGAEAATSGLEAGAEAASALSTSLEASTAGATAFATAASSILPPLLAIAATLGVLRAVAYVFDAPSRHFEDATEKLEKYQDELKETEEKLKDYRMRIVNGQTLNNAEQADLTNLQSRKKSLQYNIKSQNSVKRSNAIGSYKGALYDSSNFATKFAYRIMGYEKGRDALESDISAFKIYNEMMKYGTKNREDIDKYLEDIGPYVDSASQLLDTFNEIEAETGSLTKEQSQYRDELQGLIDDYQSIANTLNFVSNETAVYEKRVNSVVSSLRGIGPAVQDAKSAADSLSETISNTNNEGDALKSYKTILKDALKDAKNTVDGTREFWTAAEGMLGTDRLEELGWDFEKVQKEMKGLTDTVGVSSTKAYAFYEELYDKREELAKQGVEVSKIGDEISFEGIDSSNLKEVADILDVSVPLLEAYLDAASRFSNIHWDNSKALKKDVKKLAQTEKNTGTSVYSDKDSDKRGTNKYVWVGGVKNSYLENGDKHGWYKEGGARDRFVKAAGGEQYVLSFDKSDYKKSNKFMENLAAASKQWTKDAKEAGENLGGFNYIGIKQKKNGGYRINTEYTNQWMQDQGMDSKASARWYRRQLNQGGSLDYIDVNGQKRTLTKDNWKAVAQENGYKRGDYINFLQDLASGWQSENVDIKAGVVHITTQQMINDRESGKPQTKGTGLHPGVNKYQPRLGKSKETEQKPKPKPKFKGYPKEWDTYFGLPKMPKRKTKQTTTPDSNSTSKPRTNNNTPKVNVTPSPLTTRPQLNPNYRRPAPKLAPATTSTTTETKPKHTPTATKPTKEVRNVEYKVKGEKKVTKSAALVNSSVHKVPNVKTTRFTTPKIGAVAKTVKSYGKTINKSVPKQKNTKVKISGKEKAKTDAVAVKKSVNKIPSSKSVSVSVSVGNAKEKLQGIIDKIKKIAESGFHAARGGESQGAFTTVGERGRELVTTPSGYMYFVGQNRQEQVYLSKGDYVYTARQTKYITRHGDNNLDQGALRKFKNGHKIKAYNAYARGGETKSGWALTGERGRELVWSGDSAYMVGEDHPEMVYLKKGDYVFNNEDTEQITKGKKFDDVLASRAGGSMTKPSSTSGSGSTTSSKSSSGKSGKKHSSGKGGTKKKSKKKSKEAKTKFNWIERAIANIEHKITKLGHTVDNVHDTFVDRAQASRDEISAITKEIQIQQKALEVYQKKASNVKYKVGKGKKQKSVALPEKYKKLVEEGKVDKKYLEGIKNKKLANAIQKYMDYIDLIRETELKIQDLESNRLDVTAGILDQIEAKYDGAISVVEGAIRSAQKANDLLEAQGQFANQYFYQVQIDNTNKILEQQKEELKELEQALKDYENSPGASKNTEEWYALNQKIIDCKDGINDTVASVIELNNALRQLDWSIFDQAQEYLNNTISEFQFMIDTLSHKGLYYELNKFWGTVYTQGYETDYTDIAARINEYRNIGRLNERGLSVGALNMIKYEAYISQADMLGKQVAELNEQIYQQDKYDKNLIYRRNELLTQQQEAISNALEEKEAIKDLVSEGYSKMLDALEKLIDKRKAAVEATKDLYDYQQDLESQTSNIANLQKQLASITGDNSEEAAAKRQQLNQSLKDARKDLQNTQYDRWINDQSNMLDDLFSRYNTYVDEKISDIDVMFNDLKVQLENQGTIVNNTIKEEMEKLGYHMLPESMDIVDTFETLNSNTGNTATYVNDRGEFIGNTLVGIGVSAESSLYAIKENAKAIADNANSITTVGTAIVNSSGAITGYIDSANEKIYGQDGQLKGIIDSETNKIIATDGTLIGSIDAVSGNILDNNGNLIGSINNNMSAVLNGSGSIVGAINTVNGNLFDINGTLVDTIQGFTETISSDIKESNEQYTRAISDALGDKINRIIGEPLTLEYGEEYDAGLSNINAVLAKLYEQFKTYNDTLIGEITKGSATTNPGGVDSAGESADHQKMLQDIRDYIYNDQEFNNAIRDIAEQSDRGSELKSNINQYVIDNYASKMMDQFGEEFYDEAIDILIDYAGSIADDITSQASKSIASEMSTSSQLSAPVIEKDKYSTSVLSSEPVDKSTSSVAAGLSAGIDLANSSYTLDGVTYTPSEFKKLLQSWKDEYGDYFYQYAFRKLVDFGNPEAILSAFGFAQGGTIGKAIKRSGEDGFILARTGEEVLSIPKLKIADEMVNKLIQTSFAMPKFNYGNMRNLDIGGVTFTVENMNLPNVSDPESFSSEFVNALQHDNNIQKAIRSVTTDLLSGKNSLNVKRF